MSSSSSGTVINYGSGSGSDFLTSYGSGYGSGSTSQKVTVPTVPVPVPVPVPQHCFKDSAASRVVTKWVSGYFAKYEIGRNKIYFFTELRRNSAKFR